MTMPLAATALNPQAVLNPQAARSPSRYAVVLAGGSGTRLWPLSRSSMPKQLLALNGDETLLQQTARRLLPLVAAGNVVTVTNQSHRFEVTGQLHAVDGALADHVLAEPTGRNTLPAIAWAVARIARRDPQAVIGVFSSDHAVISDGAFQAAWLAAERAAEQGHIALFGMRPTGPATGYGYIEAGAALFEHDGLPVYAAARFREKPDADTARQFLAAGNFYWNGGMFVFRVERFLELLGALQPEILSTCAALAEQANPNAAAYGRMPDLSIDYGLLETAERIAVVPVDMGWSDLGSWEAIYQSRTKDAGANVTQGDVVTVDSHDNLLWSDHGVLATLGLENTAVVQTRDATLVCPRDRVEDLKGLVGAVKKLHPHLTETHLTVTRPWGSYTILEEGERYKIKRIVVNPGAKLSMQMHYHRSEHWVVICGTAKIVNGENEIYLEENQSTYIAKTHRHRLENPGRIPLQIIEIQTGLYLEEDDIVRFDDVYGRCE